MPLCATYMYISPILVVFFMTQSPSQTKVDYDGPNEKIIFFFSLILAFYQARVQGTQILLPTYRVPQWGWVMIFREKTDLSAQMTLTRKQKQIL